MTEAQFRVFVVAWIGGALQAIIPWMNGVKILLSFVFVSAAFALAGWVARCAGEKERKE